VVYGFLSNSMSGADQADYFLEHTIDRRGQLPCSLDVELNFVLASKIRAFIEYTHAELGYYEDIYTSMYYWGKVSGATDKAWLSAHCNLWVAHWGTLMPAAARLTDYTMHHFCRW
jgi:GH25 family lysozyme M1 (1,4-beta-N-acetylmuramidase)